MQTKVDSDLLTEMYVKDEENVRTKSYISSRTWNKHQFTGQGTYVSVYIYEFMREETVHQ